MLSSTYPSMLAMARSVVLRAPSLTRTTRGLGLSVMTLPHQSDFQRVLAALNIQHGGAGKEMSETEKKDNLKELSIQSKKLLHYQKSGRSRTTCPGLSSIISTS